MPFIPTETLLPFLVGGLIFGGGRLIYSSYEKWWNDGKVTF
jgi:hypothetical protein